MHTHIHIYIVIYVYISACKPKYTKPTVKLHCWRPNWSSSVLSVYRIDLLASLLLTLFFFFVNILTTMNGYLLLLFGLFIYYYLIFFFLNLKILVQFYFAINPDNQSCFILVLSFWLRGPDCHANNYISHPLQQYILKWQSVGSFK